MPPQSTVPEALARVLSRIPPRRPLARAALEVSRPPGTAVLPVPPGSQGLTASNGPHGASARRDPLLNLVHRITQGFEWDEYRRAQELGFEAYLEEQLDPLALDDSAAEARVAGYASLAMSPREILETYVAADDFSTPYLEVKQAAVLRAVYSKRQLFERLVEFWSDHFHVDHNKGDLMFLFKPEEDRTVARAHALGTFPELLSASAHSEAMLFYLDNWLNFAGTIQENYARELLELHTLGVDGGYVENDVKEVAKCLTGWTLNPDEASPDFLRTLFRSELHEPGAKFFLGQTINAYPPRHNLTRVLEIAGSHPSTARFVAGKLVRRFLTETPPEALIDQVAATFLSSGGDVKALLRVMLTRENLTWNSPSYGPKFKRPFQLVTSLLRALRAEVSDPLYPVYYLTTMGHSPFDWGPPNGYPDRVASWGSNLLPRWAFLSHLLEGYLPGVELSVPALYERLEIAGPSTRRGLARRINKRLFGSLLSHDEERAVQAFLDAQPFFLWPNVREAIALAASMPGYQWS